METAENTWIQTSRYHLYIYTIMFAHSCLTCFFFFLVHIFFQYHTQAAVTNTILSGLNNMSLVFIVPEVRPEVQNQGAGGSGSLVRARFLPCRAAFCCVLTWCRGYVWGTQCSLSPPLLRSLLTPSRGPYPHDLI